MNKQAFLDRLTQARKPIEITVDDQTFYIRDLTQSEATTLEMTEEETHEDYIVRLIATTFVNGDGTDVEGLDTLTFEELAGSMSVRQLGKIGIAITGAITGEPAKDDLGN